MHRSISAAAIVLGVVGPLSAQVLDWNNPAGGTFSTPGNWTPTGPPGSAALARFNLPNAYAVTFAGTTTNSRFAVNQGAVKWALGGFTYNLSGFPNDIGVGGASATLTVQNGNVSCGGLSVAGSTGATGTLTVDSGAAWTVASTSLTVGGAGNGTAVIQNGGSLTSGQSYVGGNSGGTGVVIVSGPGSKWTLTDYIRVGDAGSGTLTVSGGGLANTIDLALAQQVNSSGILTVTGVNSTLTVTSSLIIGVNGAASVNVLAGGKVTASSLDLGGFAGSVAAATVSGAGSTFTVSGTTNIVGFSASTPATSAALVVGAGATVNLNGTTNLQPTAIVNINGGTLNFGAINEQSGAALNWTTGTVRFASGSSITGSLLNQLLAGTNTIGAGQTLATTAGTLALGAPLLVTGGGSLNPSALTTAGLLTINALSTVSATDTVTLGTGTVTQVADLGTLAATNGLTNNGTLQLNGQSATINAFVVNLGTLQGTGRQNNGLSNGTIGTIRARAGDYFVVDGVGPTNLGDIELSGGTIEFTKTLSNLANGFISRRGEFRGSTSNPGGTGLSNSGVMAFSGGTTDVRGDVQNNSGGHIVNAGGGVLSFYDDVVHNGAEICTNAGSRTVFFGAQSGAGPFTGTGTVEYNGDLRPGNSPANVSYEGDVLLNSSTHLVMELGGTTPSLEYDRLTIQGSVTIGGALDVQFINHFFPTLGQSFTLIDNRGSGPIVGTFTGLPEGGLFTVGGMMFQATYGGGTGNDFVITPVPEPGALALCGIAAIGWVTYLRRRWVKPGTRPNGRGKLSCLVPLVSCLILALAGPASANDRLWSASAAFPGNWNVGSNWVGGVAPVSGDTLTFVNSTSNAATQNIQAGFAPYGITFASSITTFSLFGQSLNGGGTAIEMDSTGSVQINNVITLSSGQFNQLLVDGSAGTITFFGAITGANSLSIGDNLFNSPSPVTVVLSSASNTFSGPTQLLNGATLRLGVDSALPAGASVTLNAGCKLDIGTTNNTVASAAGAFVLKDGATLKVGSGANGNYYLNNLYLSGGTLTDAGLSNGITFHLSSMNGIQALAGAAGPAIISLANNGKLVNDSAAPSVIEVDSDFGGFGLDMAARLSGAGSNSHFVKSGAGTLRLLSTTNTADLTVQAGRLRFDSVSAFTSGAITLDGGKLGFFGVTSSSPKALSVTAGGGTIEIGGAATTLTLTSIISGPGPVAKVGPGTLIYGATMNYTGDTTVGEGILRVTTANALAPTGSLTVNGAGTFDLNGQMLTVNSLNITAGTVSLNGGSLNTPTASLTGVLTGPGTLAMSGPLTVLAAGALNGPVSVSMNFASSLTTGAFPVAIGSLASFFGGSALISTGGSLAIGLDNSSTTFAGVIQGAGPLTKVGTGALTLTGGNTFTGGLTVNGGAIAFAGDSSFGVMSGTVVVNPAGKVYPTGNVFTTRTYSLNGGTLEAPSGVTLTLNGATINGGFLRGAGTFIATGGAALNGVTTFGSTTINQTGPASYLNFSNGGTLNLGTGLAAPVTMSGFINRGGGQVAVGAASQMNVADFESSGVLTLVPAAAGGQPTVLTNSGLSPLYFNAGSRTFVGTPATAPVGSRPNFVAGIDLNGQNAVIAGGLFVNNGFVADSSGTPGSVIVDYGALYKGAGTNFVPVLTQNGGKVQAGNSPGSMAFGKFVFGPGGVNNYVFAIDDATGTAGPSPDAMGHVSGWGLVNAVKAQFGTTVTSGDFVWTATPSNKLTVALDTLVNPTTVGTDVSGPMANFDPAQAYAWPAVHWDGTYSGPSDLAMLDAATSFDTGGLVNSVAGTFGWSLGGSSLILSYTPSAVPEPGTLALVGLAAVGLAWRRCPSVGKPFDRRCQLG